MTVDLGNISAELRAGLGGRVIGPEDAAYDDARTVFPGDIDRRPAAIARVADAHDAARVVSLAGDAGVELAVRGGGHSPAGHGVSEGGIVLDLSDLRDLEIDVKARAAWAGTGLTTGEYTAMTATTGLTTGFGDALSIGIGGITLGGGVGLLTRKYGLTIDSLLGAEIVTADGEVLLVDEESHPDLFWAIRGGGGNFGVATKLRFRLHEVDQILGGMLVLPADPDVIAGFVAATDEAPEELSTVATVARAPALPFIPEEEHGRLVLMAVVAYAGPPPAGRTAVEPLRALAKPVADMLRPMSYPDVFPPEQEGFHPVMAQRTMFVDEVDRSTAEMLLEHVGAGTAPMSVAQLRVLGGAVARVPAEATAFPHRERKVVANLGAMFGDPGEAPAHEAWVSDFAAALRERGGSGAYLNFLADVGEDQVRAAYPGTTWDRLAAIKARYDPANLFRLNQNIPPSPA